MQFTLEKVPQMSVFSRIKSRIVLKGPSGKTHLDIKYMNARSRLLTRFLANIVIN